jgi:hypothetical protein
MAQRGDNSQVRRSNRPNTGTRNVGDPIMYPALRRDTTESPIGADESLEDDRTWEEQRPNTAIIRFDTQQSATRRTTGGVRQTGTNISRRQQVGRDVTARSTRYTRETEPPVMVKKKSNVHWLLPIGVTMVAMVVLWVVGSAVLAWGVQLYNGVRYGNPPTYQVDAVVGHNDSKQHPSHFIAMNLNRQAVIIEFPGGDPTKMITYVAPVYIGGTNGNLAPVTLEFRDVTGDGKLDMIVHIHLPNQDQQAVFINDGGKFRPANSNDKIRI